MSQVDPSKQRKQDDHLFRQKNMQFLSQQRLTWISFSYKGHENKHVPGFPNLKRRGQHTRKTIWKKEKNNVFFHFSILILVAYQEKPMVMALYVFTFKEM